jgi:hypothetical protein
MARLARRHSLRKVVSCQYSCPIAKHDKLIGIFVGGDTEKGVRDLQVVFPSEDDLNIAALTAAYKLNRVLAILHAFLPD